MSGIPCVVVASGNKTRAFAQSFSDASIQPLPEANFSAAFARTLCTFAGTYDPVATPEQQQKATEIMDAFNMAAAKIDCSRRFSMAEQAKADAACITFNSAAAILVAEILSNP